jgi:hypothetical protein
LSNNDDLNMNSGYFYTEQRRGKGKESKSLERPKERVWGRGRIVTKRVASVIKTTVEETDQIQLK